MGTASLSPALSFCFFSYTCMTYSRQFFSNILHAIFGSAGCVIPFLCSGFLKISCRFLPPTSIYLTRLWLRAASMGNYASIASNPFQVQNWFFHFLSWQNIDASMAFRWVQVASEQLCNFTLSISTRTQLLLLLGYSI